MRNVLVTGGLGFIGSNYIRYMLERYPELNIVNLDALTYAGHPGNLADVSASPNYRFVQGDITDQALVGELLGEGVEAVVHFAAETHVDRSIDHPHRFVQTNVLGTHVLLEAARRSRVRRFLHVSTDEVYGSLGPTGLFTESSPLAPNSPYSASKAGSDLLARAFWETYGLHVMTTRCSNNYGPRQHPEKLIPLLILRALQDRPLPLYGDGLNVRDWLHVEDHCRALDLVLRKGRPGEVYNVGASGERTNLEVARLILQELGLPDTRIAFVPDRPGHDRRYAIDAGKLRRELGWSPKYAFEQGIRQTIAWYAASADWLAGLADPSGKPQP
ncbi:dTDP-glucose 4,6-dehydratase [Paenibacillus sp. HJGM_3]|uniref:dTDP-glucose 4,6-dehydratase n=1 Tax=Paenibacillus sp. HJGM_3 TaxID=3379816 RepID=UPI00385BBB7F